jgi:PAS domain S-box-containing protein
MHVLTQQAAASSDVADALRRIETVLKLSRMAVWEVDREGVFTYVSSSFEDLLGYRPEELVGRRTILDFYPPELPPELQTELSEDWIGKGEEFSQLAIPLVAKSGEITWVSSSGMPIRDGEGRVVGFRGADRDITELKRAEESLRASEQDLWRQIQEAPVPMAFTNIDGKGEFHVNKTFVRTFGYGPEEIPTVEAWFARGYPDPEYRARVQRDSEDWMAQIARGELPQPREYRITRRDGAILDVEVASALVAGKFVGTFTDVTARKRSFEQARDAGAELRRVLDNVPFPVAMSVAGADFDWTDPRAKVTFFNRRLTELFGYELSDVPTVSGWACACFPAEKYRLRVMAQIDEQVHRALAGESDVGPFEATVTTKDGRVLDVILKAVTVGNQLVIAFEDQTERSRAESLLRASEETLRSLFQEAPLGIVRMNVYSQQLWVNNAFVRILGYTADDIPGFEEWMLRAYPDPAYREQVRADWVRAVRKAEENGGRIEDSEVVVTAKDGQRHEMQFSGVIVRNEVFGMWMDLTDRNNAERLLGEQREQIARVGRVSALGELAASLAHELDQPLGAILNNAETARIILTGKKPKISELGAIVDDIIEDDRRAGDVLDRIRAMVQKQPFRSARIDVPELFRELGPLIKAAVGKKPIVVEVSCEPGLPPIEGDRVLLQQALLNLVLNSVNAIGVRDGGVISLRAGEAGAHRVGISVSDNGGGVPPEEADQLLQPFHTTKEGGLGMGLPIVNSIVEQHGGSLRVDNQPGRGLSLVLVLSVWKGKAGG